MLDTIQTYTAINNKYKNSKFRPPVRNNGTHWVALWFDFNTGIAEYFDPFGKGPRNTVTKVLTDADIIIEEVNIKVQIDNGDDCGIWCCWYGMNKINGATIKDLKKKDISSPKEFRIIIDEAIKKYANETEILKPSEIQPWYKEVPPGTMLRTDFQDEDGNYMYEPMIYTDNIDENYYYIAPPYVREASKNIDKWLKDPQIHAFLQAVNRTNYNNEPVSIETPLADFMVNEWFNNFLINEDPNKKLENKRLIVLNLA